MEEISGREVKSKPCTMATSWNSSDQPIVRKKKKKKSRLAKIWLVSTEESFLSFFLFF